MKNFILAFLASASFGIAAHAAEPTLYQGVLPPPPQNSECLPGHCWQNWGGAPFAKSEVELHSQAKLDKYFDDAEISGVPHKVTMFAKAYMVANPDGGSPFYLTPHMRLLMMESLNKPMFDVTVAEIPIALGEVKAATAVAFGVYDPDTNTVYVFVDPRRCRNGSVYKVVLPPPPVLTPAPIADNIDCDHIFVGHVPQGAELHQDTAARRPYPPSACGRTAIMINRGGHGRKVVCDTCGFQDSLEDLRAKRYLLMLQPGDKNGIICLSANGCDVVETLGRTVEERKDDDIELFCITYPDGSRVYVKDIHWYSFHNRWAYIIDGPVDQIPENMRERFLAWQASGGLPHIWEHVTNPPHYGDGTGAKDNQ